MNTMGAGILALAAALMAAGALRQRSGGATPVRRSLTVGLWVASLAAIAMSIAVAVWG